MSIAISTALLIILAILIIITKRKALFEIFSTNISNSTKELQTELENTADSIIRKMENHITHLEYLLSEAEEKIAVLDKKLELANELINASEATNKNTLKHIDTTQEIYTTDTVRTIESLDYDSTNIDQQPEYISSSPNSTRKVVKEIISDDKKRLILAMYEQGYNATEIAKATMIGKGEIMLVLQLNKK
ncbi:DUF6115 domain-containing protein [Dendrosporobacter sp. 1207_IL3150]|uniref:DUF6115 domain-containing protein n=1 Tax=Dendrosporobacter sp. 1207_IL3150 TaxID=3084054 RepID=UPI002FDB9591